MTQRLWRTLGAATVAVLLVSCGVQGEAPEVGEGPGARAEHEAAAADVQGALRALPDVQVAGSEAGVPFFVRGALGQVPSVPGDVRGAAAQAELAGALRTLAPVFRLSEEQLVLKRVRVDEQGHRHLRYQQLQHGLPVVGGELLLHVDTAGRVYAANGSARGGVASSPLAWVASDEAQAAALAHTDAFPRAAADQPRLVYLRPDGGEVLELAWEVRVLGDRAGLPVDDLVYVHAHKGAVLAVHPQVHTAMNRRVYSANNGTSLPGTLKRSEGGAATGDTHVDDNYGHLGTTYQCYSQVFGRDSYNNAGATLTSTVHYSTNYVNAFWNGSQMVYGDGDGVDSGPLGRDLDVTVHELTHAVTDSESDLVYSNESGALNEGMSDIFAAFCEAWTRSWSMDDDVWKIGEDIWTPATSGDALRYMANPTQDGSSRDYYPERYTGTSDNGGVHWNSGIANLAFKLLSTGGTHPRSKTTVNVTGIGVEKAGRIFYKANTDLFTSSTTFAQAKTYTEQAATQLGYDSATVASVTAAWQAVGVGSSAPPPTTTPLSNGVPVSNLSGATGSEASFTLAVPSGASNLTFTISGGSGDADLYVKFGSQPTTSSYDCRPYKSGNSETCSFATPQVGTYYVMLRGYSSYSGVTLTGSYGTGGGGGGNVLQDGVPVSNLSGASGSTQTWTMSVPSGVSTLTFTISGGSGDADMYVRYNAAPTTSSYDCRPYRSGNNETCSFSSPSSGTWYVMLRGYTSYSGVTLQGQY